MKKIFITLFFLTLIQAVSLAQINQADREIIYTPEAGNFAVGLDASPFLNYMGNLFNGTVNNRLNFTDNNIYLKYFISDQGALRLSFRVSGIDKVIINEYVRDDAAFISDPLSRLEVIDRRIEISENYAVRAGYQHFIGDGRLRGFVGADAGYGASKTLYNYEYGNQITQANPRPTTSTFAGNTNNPADRNTEIMDQNIKMAFGSLFTGAEYFVIPMLSLGLELGIQYGHTFYGQRYRQYETLVGTQVVSMDETLRASRRARNMQTVVPVYGALTINFHF
jgi:hypothetical protein